MHKSRGIFARVLIDIDMLSALSNQILVERPNFAFIAYIEFENFPPFCSSCKMIRHDISKYRQHPHNLNNIAKPPTIVFQT